MDARWQRMFGNDEEELDVQEQAQIQCLITAFEEDDFMTLALDELSAMVVFCEWLHKKHLPVFKALAEVGS